MQPNHRRVLKIIFNMKQCLYVAFKTNSKQVCILNLGLRVTSRFSEVPQNKINFHFKAI